MGLFGPTPPTYFDDEAKLALLITKAAKGKLPPDMVLPACQNFYRFIQRHYVSHMQEQPFFQVFAQFSDTDNNLTPAQTEIMHMAMAGTPVPTFNILEYKSCWSTLKTIMRRVEGNSTAADKKLKDLFLVWKDMYLKL